MNEDIDVQKLLEENKKLKEELDKSSKKEEFENNNVHKKKFSKKLFIPIIFFIVLIIIGAIIILFVHNRFNIEKFKKNIVLIQAYNYEDELFATGSGVYIDQNTVYTNAHVIKDAERIEIILDDNSKIKLKGIQSINEKKDIAILVTEKVESVQKLKMAKNVKIGTEVYAVGSPLGIKNSVSDGVISTKTKDKNMKVTIYQHTAPISPGSSGGALINKRGELIGINYASYEDGQNLNLAIKISEFNKINKKTKNDKLIKKATSSFFKVNELMNQPGKEIIRETCSISTSCHADIEEDGFYKDIDEYKNIKDNVKKVIRIETLRGYDQTYEDDEWLRIYLFQMKKKTDKYDENFKSLVDSMALTTRDTYYNLVFNHYWAINNNYYYYIEYSDHLNITNIVEKLRILTGGEYE